MSDRTALSDRMHALAESGHPRADELREKADAFDMATRKFYGDKSISPAAFLGAFARARKLWCEITGESLI